MKASDLRWTDQVQPWLIVSGEPAAELSRIQTESI